MDKNDFNTLMNYISPKLRKHLRELKSEIWDTAEEIHLGLEKPAIIYHNGGFNKIFENNNEFICDEQVINETLMLITENSIYAANNRLVNGFITLKGGHRAGICGTTVISNGKVSSIKEISSLNIRIKREIKYIADALAEKILYDNGNVRNTLIISPPKCGKTTLLRDFARMLGNFKRVVIIDERSEIASMYRGIAQNDVGIHTDVINGCGKEQGIPLAIRCMAPEIILTDEIGNFCDIEALNYAARSGVSVIATAHGYDVADILKKPNFNLLITFFDYFIVLTNIGKTGTIKEIVRREDVAV